MWDSEVAHGRTDDPFTGRRDGPDVASSGAQLFDELTYLGKDVGRDGLGEVVVAGLLDGVFAEPAMHGDHFSAHDVFGNVAGVVVGVAGASPANDGFGDEASGEFPGEEAFASVSGPERAVAVEGGNLWMEA